MKLDHVGVVVKSIEKSVLFYEKVMGFNRVTEVLSDPIQKVNVLFLDAGSQKYPMTELVEPQSKESLVYKFLEKNSGGLHHFSYTVENLEKAIEHFKKNKAMPISQVYTGAGHPGSKIVWFYTPEKILIEIIEQGVGKNEQMPGLRQ